MGMKPSEIVIELDNVEKYFGQQKVLDGVSLQVRAGTTTVIVGASGQGKSVILKHMLGLMRPDAGRVVVFGQDLAQSNTNQLRDIRSHFGVLFQNVALFDSMSVYDNVALPLRERTHKNEADIRVNVEEKLALMGLEDHGEKFPAQLSGGMQKRVGLARALVLNPKVVPKIFKLSDSVALMAEGKLQGCMSPEAFQLSDNPLIRSFVLETMGPIYSSETEEALLYETL